jgi:hypothetical protein
MLIEYPDKSTSIFLFNIFLLGFFVLFKDESNLCKSLIQAKKSSGCIVGIEIKGKGFSCIRITIFLISELCITVFHI